MSKGSTLASEPLPIPGRWHAPGSARSVEALLKLDASGLVNITGGQGEALASAMLRHVAISDRVGSIPRTVTFSDGSSFVTDGNDAVDGALRASGRHGSGIVHSLEMFRPRLFVLVALVMALSFAVYRFALPVMIELAVAATPPAVPGLLSRGTLASLDGSILEPTSLGVDDRVAIHRDFRAIAALSERGVGGYALHFRGGGTIGPNAFALPDGTIVLTDELVRLAADDREAVVGVLAHEIGHVEAEHSLRRLYQAAGVAALVMLVAGDIGQAAEDLLVQGAALVSLSYSRDQEREADRYSVRLMHDAGRDPAAIVRFLELLRDRLGDRSGNDFLSTHPATVERIEETRRMVRELTGKAAD